MLHKYTLKFSAQEWEDQYLEYLYPQMQKELSCFSLFAIGFAMSNFLLASINGYLIYALISLFAMIVVVYGKYLLSKKPNYLNYILGVYQVLVSISFLANDYLPLEQKISNQFVWSYGFQCSFFHFCMLFYIIRAIYLQGTNFVSQNIILLCIFALYISVSQIDSLQGILNMFMWIFMFVSMVMIKHNYEIRKKEEFFHSQQQIKWDKIVQSVLPTYVMLIGYNQKQDQLVLKKINRQVQKHFQISDDKDMRKYLRQLIIQKSVKLTVGQQINEDNFETYIRNMIQIDKYSDPIMQNNTTQLYVKHSENQQVYKAKLVQCILENELQCLLVLQRIQTNQQILTKVNKQISVDIIALCVNQSRQVMQILSYLKGVIKMPQDYYRDHIYNYNSLLNFQYVLLSYEINSRYQLLNQLRIQSLLKNIFGSKLDNLNVNGDFYYRKMTFTRTLVACIRLIAAFNDDITPQFDVNIQVDDLINVTIIFKSIFISKTMLYLLQQNWAYNTQRQFRIDSIYLLVLSKITEFHQLFQKRLSLLTLFEICSLSITLAQFGVKNYLDIEKDSKNLIVKYSLNTKDNVNDKLLNSFSHQSIHLSSPKSDTA